MKMYGYSCVSAQRLSAIASTGLALVLAISCDRKDYRNGSAEAAPAAVTGRAASVSGETRVRELIVAPGLVLDEDVPQERSRAEPAPGLEADGLRVVVLTPQSAKVTWTTPHASDSELRWGMTSRLEATPILEPELTTQHTVLLDQLKPGQTYHVQASSRALGEAQVQSDVLSFRTLDREEYVVRKDHPRIFFTADDLPALRRKAETTHSRPWVELKRNCESSLSRDAADIASAGSCVAYARAFALAGLIANESRFKKKAEDIALSCASLGGSGEKMDVRLRAMAVASVYDWLHGDLTETSRARLRRGLRDMCTRLEEDSNSHEFVWGHTHGNHRPLVLATLAMYGEEAQATESLDGFLRAYRDGFFATWRNYGEEGGSLKGWWYTTWTLDMEVEVMAAVATATNVNWFKTETWFNKLVDWYALGFRGDGTFLRSGDHRPDYTLSQFEWIYALCAAHYYRNPQAKWLAQRIAQEERIWALYNVFALLWDDADLAAEPPTGSLTRHFPTAGHVLLRSSWDNDAVIGTFRSASDYTLGHTHLDNNSITLFYKGGLAINSGMYDHFGSAHDLNYYRRTIAHNTLLVHDPEEVFVTGGKTVVNDGGQRFRNSREDGIPRSFPARVEDTLDPTKGYGAGGILRFEDTAEYAYAVGDATPSYSKRKLSLFDRHVLWLKPASGGDRPMMVVFDVVTAKSAGFKKTYLLHTENRPAVDGTLVSATNNGGILYQRTLLPTAPRIEIVGGPGKEFLVGGSNFATVRAPTEKDEVGNWRVEVSPSQASATDYFLHVLFTGDVGVASPPRSSRLASNRLVGATVDGWVILFAPTRSGVEEASFALARGAWKNLLVGLVPNGSYEVAVDGTVLGSFLASREGLLRFDTAVGGEVEIRRTTTVAVSSARQ